MIETLRAPLMALTILLGTTALAATSGAAAARGASQDHKEHKVHKDHDDKHRAHRKKHAKKIVCIKAPCSPDGGKGKGKTKPVGDANKDKPAPAPVGGLRPAKGDVVVSNGVTATILHGAGAGVVVQSLEPGKIIVRADNGQSVTLPGGSVSVSGAKIVSPGVAIQRVDHPNGEVTLAVGPGIQYPKPTAPTAPAAPAPVAAPGHVTGGPEGGILGAIGGSIIDAGKAVGRGAEDAISIGSPKPGTPGAGEPKTSTTTQQ